MARTPADVINDVRRSLRLLGSPQATFPEYGNTWAICRAVAGVILDQEQALLQARSQLSISNATGLALTQRAAEMGVQRIEGKAAQGMALMKLSGGSATVYPANTLVSTTDRRLVYRLVNPVSLGTVERAVEIASTGYSANYNLSAGTTLYMPSDPNVLITVGVVREAGSGVVRGGISNGRNQESDEQLSRRVLRFIRGTNAQQLESLLFEAVPEAGRIYAVEHVPITGYLTIYAETQNQEVLGRLRSAVEFHKPPGITFLVRGLKPSYVDITIRFKARQDLLEEVSAAVRLQSQYYFDTLGPVGKFDPAIMAQYVTQSVSGALSLQVLTPQHIITPEQGARLELGNLNLQLEPLV